MNNIAVHLSHCCALHGCKYCESDCPVATGAMPQKYNCEDCQDYYQPSVKSVVEVDNVEQYAQRRTHFVYRPQMLPLQIGQILVFKKAEKEVTCIVSDIEILHSISIASLIEQLYNY